MEPEVRTFLKDENLLWSGVHEYQLVEGPMPDEANGGIHDSCWPWVAPRDYKLVEITLISGEAGRGDRRRVKTNMLTGESKSETIPGPHPLVFGGCVNGVDRFRREEYPFRGVSGERFSYNIVKGDSCYFVIRGPGYSERFQLRIRCWYNISRWQALRREVQNNPAPYAAVATFFVSSMLSLLALFLGS